MSDAIRVGIDKVAQHKAKFLAHGGASGTAIQISTRWSCPGCYMQLQPHHFIERHMVAETGRRQAGAVFDHGDHESVLVVGYSNMIDDPCASWSVLFMDGLISDAIVRP